MQILLVSQEPLKEKNMISKIHFIKYHAMEQSIARERRAESKEENI